MKRWIQDKFCPLHLFCRLKDRGWGAKEAAYVCLIYEVGIYSPLGLR
jgi:hypothetical protein